MYNYLFILITPPLSMLSVMYCSQSLSSLREKEETCGRLTASHSIITNELIHLSITRERKEILADN